MILEIPADQLELAKKVVVKLAADLSLEVVPVAQDQPVATGGKTREGDSPSKPKASLPESATTGETRLPVTTRSEGVAILRLSGDPARLSLFVSQLSSAVDEKETVDYGGAPMLLVPGPLNMAGGAFSLPLRLSRDSLRRAFATTATEAGPGLSGQGLEPSASGKPAIETSPDEASSTAAQGTPLSSQPGDRSQQGRKALRSEGGSVAGQALRGFLDVYLFPIEN
jgi:hypothetical protein